MRQGTPAGDGDVRQRSAGPTGSRRRVLPDGGEPPGDERGEDGDAEPGDGSETDDVGPAADDDGAESDGGSTDDADDGDGRDAVDRSNVEVSPAGESEPADPRWEKPDVDEIPEVEGPKTRPAAEDGASTGREFTAGGTADDPTAGMPNTARAPGASRVSESGTEGFVVALELCAQLPDDARLPEEAADLVPVALEAELEQDVQAFAGQEFDNPSPHVETLEFVEVDDELWLRLRLGVPREAFTDLDPEAIREHALQGLDGLL